MCNHMAAATYTPGKVAGPVIRKGVKWGCRSGNIYAAYKSHDWLGYVKGEVCGYFGEVFAGAAGVFAAGATAETGPVAVAVGLNVYHAFSASLKLVCGGVFNAIGSSIGGKLESDHETHIAIDVIRKGKCISLKQRFGTTQWSAIDCPG